MKHIRRLIVAGAALALLTSCSTMKFAYNRVDWIVAWQFDDYVDLHGAAQDAFDEGFAELWRWHRSTQLPLYGQDLREIADASREPLDREQVRGYLIRASEHGRRLLGQAIPPFARVLAELDDAQVASMLKKMARDRADEAREVAEKTPDERRAKREREAAKSVKRWLGSVSKAQTAMVRDWALARRDEPVLWQRYDEQWAEAFKQALAARAQPGFEQTLQGLFLDPQLPDAQAAREIRDYNRDQFAELIARLSASLSEKQRAHSRAELLGLAEDFEELAAQSRQTPPGASP